jgi:hypothetical protein
MHLKIITQIMSLKILILSGYILLFKSGQQIKLRGDINGVVVDILEKEIKEGLREIEGFDSELDEYILVDTGTNSEQDAGQDQALDQSQKGQEGQDIEPRDQGHQQRRYPFRKRQLTIKAAAVIVE